MRLGLCLRLYVCGRLSTTSRLRSTALRLRSSTIGLPDSSSTTRVLELDQNIQININQHDFERPVGIHFRSRHFLSLILFLVFAQSFKYFHAPRSKTGADLTGLKLWYSAAPMFAHIRSKVLPKLLAERACSSLSSSSIPPLLRVLELGSGTGFLGIALAATEQQTQVRLCLAKARER